MRMKGPAKKTVAFTTKDGKTIQFKPKGTRAKMGTAHVKQLEKRLSAMEKAVLKYNNAVQNQQAKRKARCEGGQCSDGKSIKHEDKSSKGKAPVKTASRD